MIGMYSPGAASNLQTFSTHKQTPYASYINGGSRWSNGLTRLSFNYKSQVPGNGTGIFRAREFASLPSEGFIPMLTALGMTGNAMLGAGLEPFLFDQGRNPVRPSDISAIGNFFTVPGFWGNGGNIA